MEWIPQSTIEVIASPFEDARVMLDSSYPDGVGDVPNPAFKYYATSFEKPNLEDPSSALSTIFKFEEPVQLCGIKIRGENYDDMQHMVKGMRLFCTNNIQLGHRGEWWTEVASFEAKAQRGWQMFTSRANYIADPQKLCDKARDSGVCNMAALENHMMDEESTLWNVHESSPWFAKHNAVDCSFVEWARTPPAKYYRLDVVSNYDSYIALAEINFLMAHPLILQLCPVPPQAAGTSDVTMVECRELSGNLRLTLTLDAERDLPSRVCEELAKTLAVPFEAILPDCRMLTQLGDTESLQSLLSLARMPIRS